MSRSALLAGGTAKERSAAGGAGRFLLGLTACHAVNDFYGLVLPPLLPALQAAFHLSYLQLGLLTFAATAVSAVAQPLAGYWADRHRRRRPALVAGFCLYPVAMALVGLAPSYGALLAAATVLGLAASTYHPQSTTLLLARFAARRGWASGIHGIGNSIGFALAPVLVGPLADRFGWRAAALVLAFPALAAAALIWRLAEEPALRVARGLRAGFSRPLLLLAVINGVLGAVVAGFVTFLPAYYAGHGTGLALAGLLTAPTLAAGLLAQPLGGALSDRFGRRGVFAGALVGLGLSVLLFPYADGWPLVALALLAGFWGSLGPPVVLVYAAELAPGGRTGQAVGLAWGVGIAISSLAGPATGAAIDAFGFVPAYSGLGVLALASAAAALALPHGRELPASQEG
jgi:FSR family fosmidomycin resistance protein-like MFS transporter